MAVQGQFEVEGFQELFKRMDEIREEIGKGKTDKIWRRLMGVAFTPVLEAAKQAAPHETYQLRDGIGMYVGKPKAKDKKSTSYQGEMYTAIVYSSIKRDDIKYKVVLNKRGKFQTVLTNKKPVPVSQEFGNARVPMHPYIRISLERNMGRVMNSLEQELKNVINNFDMSKKMGS